jgi:hypothetical protein
VTPKRYIEELEALVADHQWERGLALPGASANQVAPPLSAEDYDRVEGLMEVVTNIAQLNRGDLNDASEALPHRTER